MQPPGDPSTRPHEVLEQPCCAQVAALLLSPSRPFQGTIPITSRYFYTMPASPGSWQAGALALVPGSSNCSRTISKPPLYSGATTHPISSRGPFSCSARAPRSLHKPHPSTHEASSPPERLQTAFLTLPSVSVS